jgi:hypothetical protein
MECAFCPEDAVERGGEHMWDNWANKALPKTRYRARKRYSLNSPLIEYATSSLNEQVPVVCTECNSGWMSVLTNKVREYFGPAILNGEPFVLGARGAATLAAFTFMKAVVTNHIAHGNDPFFARAVRHRFGTSLTIPPFKAWIAAFDGKARFSARSNFAVFSTEVRGPLYGIEFGSFTYVVGKLALQLLAPRWKYVNRGSPVSLNPNIHWETVTIQFWPYSNGFPSWPLAKYLDDYALKAFIERFGNTVNVPIS